MDNLGRKLVEQLNLVQGDVTSTYEVLYKFYRAKSDTLNNKLNKSKKSADAAQADSQKLRLWDAKDLLHEELDNDMLGDFLVPADMVWYNAILDHYKSFHCISDELIPK